MKDNPFSSPPEGDKSEAFEQFVNTHRLANARDAQLKRDF